MHGRWIRLLLTTVVAVYGVFLFGLPPAAADMPGYLRARMGSLQGTIVLPPGTAMPADGVMVSFFERHKGPPPTEAGLHRIPEMVVRSDSDGSFHVSLLPGDYYVGALMRPRGEGPGPPKPGEKFFFALDDAGNLAAFQVRTRETTSAGAIQEAVPSHISELANFVTVKGTVTDQEGQPYAGALVLVKDDPNVARPLFISSPTDEQGRYLIKVPPDTTYYLVARQSIQTGRPMPGAYVGTFGKTDPTVDTGQSAIGAPAGVVGRGGKGEATPVRGVAGTVIDHVDITMFKVPDPEANRRKYQKKPSTDKPGPAASSQPAAQPKP